LSLRPRAKGHTAWRLCSFPLSFHGGAGSERPAAVKGAPLFRRGEPNPGGEGPPGKIKEGRERTPIPGFFTTIKAGIPLKLKVEWIRNATSWSTFLTMNEFP